MPKKAKKAIKDNQRVAVFVFIFAVIGVILLVQTFAAGNQTSLETEKGSLIGGAKIVSDSNASGGQAVQFNAPSGDPMKFGLNTSGGVWCEDDNVCSEAESLNRLNDVWTMGARWLRHDYEWSNIQNCNPHTSTTCANSPSSWNWNERGVRWDEFTKQAHAKGFKILATLDYSPSWAMGEIPNTYASDYGAFAKAFVQHYKSLGYTSNDIVIELGNEEDLPNGTWCTTDNTGHTTCSYPNTEWPELVARKEQAAYAAIKGVDSSFKVVSGFSGFGCDAETTSTPCSSSSTSGWDMVAFYRALYKFIQQPSVNWKTNQLYDYLAVHPYCWGSDTGKVLGVLPATGVQSGDCPWNEMLGLGNVATQNSIIGVMKANGDNQVIWPTETGYYWLNGSGVSTAQQLNATSLTNAYTYMQQPANASKFGPLFWYSYESWNGQSTGQQYGLLSGNNESTPITSSMHLTGWKAYQAAAQAAAK